MTKQIGVFKPKKMKMVRPIQKYRNITISTELHEILSCEKTERESFNDCISRILKERAALRVEISQLHFS